MVIKRSKIIALVVCVLFTLSIGVGAAGAQTDDAVSDAVDEISKIYEFLDEGDKEDILDAKNEAKELNPENKWVTDEGYNVIDAIYTDDGIKKALENSVYDKSDLKEVIVDFAKINYSTNEDELQSALENFKRKHQEIIGELLPGISANELIQFYVAWKSELPNKIKNNKDSLIQIAAGDYESIEDSMNTWAAEALREVLNYEKYNELNNKLVDLNLSVDKVITAKNRFTSIVDSDKKAEIALAKGYIRSEVEKTQGDNTLEVGDTTIFNLNILGVSVPKEVIDWKSSDKSVATVDGNEITAEGEGSATITAYKPGGEPDTTWIYSTTVKVEPADTGDGDGAGDGGGVGPSPEPSEPGEAAEEAQDIIEDPGASEQEIAESVGNAADSIDNAAREIETAEDAEKLVDTAGELSDALDKAVDRVQGADAAADLGDSINKIASALASASEKVTSEEGKKKIEDNFSRVMNTVSKAFSKMDAEKAAEVARTMIGNAGNLSKNLEGDAVRNVADRTTDMAEKAVERAGTDKVSEDEITREGEKAVAEANPERINEKAQQAVKTAQDMEESLQENGIDAGRRVLPSVTIEVPETGSNEVETRLPAGTLDALADNNVSKLNVNTETGSFSISPDTFGEQAEGRDISLSAGRVDRDDLSPSERAQVPSGSSVVDLGVTINGNEPEGDFETPVEASIPYELGEDEDPSEVTVFVMGEDGEIEAVGGVYNPETGRAEFTTPHFSEYFAKPATKSFNDLADFEWAQDTVEIMAGKGLIAGRTSTSFAPAADITRAEFSALVVRMLTLGDPGIEELPFKDVASDAWYRDVVAKAYANDIVGGKAADVFDPDGKITRQEMAVIISRIMVDEGYKPGKESELAKFGDRQQIADWARKGAALATREGIVKGLPGDKFAPQQKANRAQAAVMLFRLYEKLY